MSKYGLHKTPLEMMQMFAQNIRVIRKQQGMSQHVLSQKSGVSYSTLRKFELTGVISLESFLKLCKALNRLEEFDSVLKSNDLGSKKNLFDY